MFVLLRLVSFAFDHTFSRRVARLSSAKRESVRTGPSRNRLLANSVRGACSFFAVQRTFQSYLPEVHVIRKDHELYDAFFARHWSGPIELRGLEDRTYRIVDYVNNKDLGRVHGPKATLSAEFDKHLLLDAQPE
jgi:hypothetical protein